jgi:hypothetical protein
MSMSVYEANETRHSNQIHSSKLLEGETLGGRQLVIALTPITNTRSLLSPRVKHRTDNHEARSDRTFAHSEDETDDEETRKVLASGMATQSNCPDEYVQARDSPLQKMEARANCGRHASSIFRRETFEALSSGETRRRDN